MQASATLHIFNIQKFHIVDKKCACLKAPVNNVEHSQIANTPNSHWNATYIETHKNEYRQNDVKLLTNKEI